jgi:Glycosyltransferase family 87
MIFLVLCQIGICFGGLSSALGGLDFRTFYAAGHMVRSGEAVQIYDLVSEKRVQDAVVAPRPEGLPFFNPAYAALPFVLLSLFSYKVAYFVFFALNLTMAVLAAAVMRPYLAGLTDKWQGLPIFLFLCFFPVGIALREGQLSLIVLLLYCACFAATQTSRPFVAGLLLALSLIKFQIALPMALLFLVWRRWRFVAGFACGSVALAGLSLWITGLGSLSDFWHSIGSSIASSSVLPGTLADMSVPLSQMARMPNIYGFFYSIAHGAHWGQVL